MEKRMQIIKHRLDDGGRIEDVCPIVNDNADAQAAMRDAMAAGRRADARRQANERRLQRSWMLRDAACFFAGIGVMMLAAFPAWMGLATLAASVYIRCYSAILALEVGKNA